MINISINQKARLEKQMKTEDVLLFSELSLDKNPIHLDNIYAHNTIFKEKIVHGFLYASLISAIIANELPGNGSIYKEQNIKFLKPVYHDDIVEAVVIVKDINYEKKEVLLETNCYVKNEMVLTGFAKIKNFNL
jgi:3-hydroxybutyryl-CoA dehydratase